MNTEQNGPSKEVPAPKVGLQDKLKALMNEYAGVALGTYLAIFAAVFGGFYAAMNAGLQVDSAAGSASLFAGAFIATKATQPLRIGATLLMTPLVAKIVRLKKKA